MKNILLLFISSILFSSCNTVAFIFAKKPSHKIVAINFTENTKPNYTFFYPDTLGDLFLRQLRVENNLTKVVEKAKTDTEQALLILSWTHAQWAHNGSNNPSKHDAITILKEAKQGSNFRCVEYGIVAKSALLALGKKARGVGLQTKDVETCDLGAGHYLAEVWLADIQKWALIDGQFNIMPVLQGIPLNAVEFQQAIINKQPFVLVNSAGAISKQAHTDYMNFIPHYLFYFTTGFDQRQKPSNEIYRVNGKSSLMLVPLNAKKPTVFQKKYPNTDFEYSNALNDFYTAPQL
jgi:hypothetical protein